MTNSFIHIKMSESYLHFLDVLEFHEKRRARQTMRIEEDVHNTSVDILSQ